MFKSSFLFVIALGLIFFNSIVAAQSFGFGCLGLVGGYGGYSYQVYKPTGLNNYINTFNIIRKDSLKGPMQSFGKSTGYRVGVNFFRANIKGLILTAKGFYQDLSEESDANVSGTGGTSSTNYNFDLKSWGIGVDLGTSLTSSLSWKVIDAVVLFNTAQFTSTTNLPGAQTIVETYKSDKQILGYTFGTGFILAIIGQYISLEGLAGYTYLKIDKIRKDDGSYLPVNELSTSPMNNFIDAGGFNAVIQLNIGFPL
jgi:hypothetical protein